MPIVLTRIVSVGFRITVSIPAIAASWTTQVRAGYRLTKAVVVEDVALDDPEDLDGWKARYPSGRRAARCHNDHPVGFEKRAEHGGTNEACAPYHEYSLPLNSQTAQNP